MRATVILAIAIAVVFGQFLFAFCLLVAVLATFLPIAYRDVKLLPASTVGDAALEDPIASKSEEVQPEVATVGSKPGLTKTWTDSVKLADTGVAMPAAQVARAWLQMARSKDVVFPRTSPSAKASRPRPSQVGRAGSSSDLCGSITEGDTDPCSEGTPTAARHFPQLIVELERKHPDESWGFQWRRGARRFILEAVDDQSLAGVWNEQQVERGFRSLELGSTLLEANGSNHRMVMKQELDEALHVRLTFSIPDEALIEKLDGPSLECRIKNSFLEVTAVDSHDERRNFSDPGPIITKAISSAPEGYGSQGPDGIGGYVTESEAVSDLIGSTALIAGLTDSLYNGRFCRIEAFDPQVRRYVVRVYTEEGPENAKLRLENLILQSSAFPSFPAPASFQEFQTALPCQPEAFLNPYNPWAWPPSLAFQDFQDASNAMLMQTLPQPWGPMGETPWSQYGIPSMLGAEIPMDGSHMLPSLPPSMPTLPPLSTTPVANLQPFPFTEGLAPLPSDGPLIVHTHQAVEQQLTRPYVDVLSAPQGQQEMAENQASAGAASVEAFQGPEPCTQEAHHEVLEKIVEPETEAADVKKKRRRRRRGKRKGQKAAEVDDSGSEELSCKEDAEVAQVKDAQNIEPGFQPQKDASSREQLWQPRLPRNIDEDMTGQEGAEVKEDLNVSQSLNMERGSRPSEWKPSLPKSFASITSSKDSKVEDGRHEVLQAEVLTDPKAAPWQPTLHRIQPPKTSKTIPEHPPKGGHAQKKRCCSLCGSCCGHMHLMRNPFRKLLILSRDWLRHNDHRHTGIM